MDKLVRDLTRLEVLSEDQLALEALSTVARFQDFVTYYFTRFLTNLRVSFKDYTKSELELYIARYKTQLKHVLTNPLVPLDTFVVPIPRGMVKSYGETLEALLELLVVTSGEDIGGQLEKDLISIAEAIEQNDLSKLYHPVYTKRIFDGDKASIGSLYTKVGLTHLPANHALESMKKTEATHDLLSSLIMVAYPAVLTIHDLIIRIEKAHASMTLSAEDNRKVSAVLMDAAYRVTIFSVIMGHILDMEHAWVKTLDVLKRKVAEL